MQLLPVLGPATVEEPFFFLLLSIISSSVRLVLPLENFVCCIYMHL